jgi:PBP1b-binding outer membrane lipoprotein LpoB
MKKQFTTLLAVLLLVTGCASPASDNQKKVEEKPEEPEAMEIEEESEVEIEENQESGGF